MGETTLKYTNLSDDLYRGRCKLHSVSIAGDGAGADCQVYDGTSVKGELKVHLEALTGVTHQVRYEGGVDFAYGIYIAVNAATTKVTVEYEPIKR